MNIASLATVLPLMAELQKTVMLHGEHGTGKSQVIRQIWEKLGYKVADVRLGQMADAGDLIGLPQFMKDKDGKDYLKYVFPDFFPRQEKTVIFFDELNRAPKDILQGVFEMVLDYSLKGVKLPKDTVIICAVNPATDDYAVLDFSDKAFQDRFVHIKFNPTPSEFHNYMKTKFPTSGLLAYTQEDNKMLSGKLQSFDINFVEPSRRSWEVAFKLEEMYDNGRISRDNFMEVLMGVVGLEATTAGMTFKDTHVGSIKGKDIVENYHTGEIRSRLLKAVEKGRTDIVGNSLQEINEIFVERKTKGLTAQEGKNIIDLASDLGAEQTYTLISMIASNHDCCSNVEGMPETGDGAGLLGNDDLVAVLDKTRAAREKAAKAMEKRKKKEAKEVAEV